MNFTEQIEQYVVAYPLTSLVSVPATCGVTTLPAFPSVVVQPWAEDYCELEESSGVEIARFRLVG